MTMSETAIDRRLLASIQQAFPLAAHPYAQLARELGLTEDSVMLRIVALREDGIIREISGIFDSAALGYHQTLAAFAVPPERLEQAGRLVAAHPGVSHCYARQHRVNLWFTLAVSPSSLLGLEKTIKLLASTCGATQLHILPTLRRYKLQVHFDFGPEYSPARENHSRPTPPPPPHAAKPPQLREDQLRAIQALQVDLPVQEDPFSPLAELADTSADGLIMHAHDFIRLGYLRRYAAVLHHRAAGAAANVLVAWDAPDERADAAGAACAGFAEVSHCYLRPRGSDWPYNLYTMIHGRSTDECRTTIQAIAAATSLQSRTELWTTAEFKKQRIKLLGPEERQWEVA